MKEVYKTTQIRQSSELPFECKASHVLHGRIGGRGVKDMDGRCRDERKETANNSENTKTSNTQHRLVFRLTARSRTE